MATMGVIEGCRILSGWKGNLTESKGSIGVSLVLIVPAVLSCVYLLVFQSYVLRWVLHCCTAPVLLHLREVSQYLKKAPIRAFSLLKAPTMIE